ncbi:DUF3987 domain-containing protein [Bradyrhizobium sacchari]|uniref:Bifunctional DNA primase/polymerase-like protein n=1 Tax=Bradyrhizobium sacchari TaxID=1399419 RepID=A0A560J6W0_9BRAD|nr:DUF3987 domain-containing protein [Bradyrhizobium sacchari]TWB66615.1 bifunctional DNA primase/polymerase-like protein [Bradyrhizobium sacchari]TWB83851.1 bifunctional DNA primase/polymerase-like protein [Bradyrhizobium sacchari]
MNTTTIVDNQRTALGLAELGFDVFPLLPNQKTPALRDNWKDVASRDPARIKRHWSGENRARNIGIRTGMPFQNGFLVVIDIDTKDGKPGMQSIAELEEQLGKLPATTTFRTASGGEHRYFVAPWPLGNSNSKLGPGIDVKGVGGYVVGCGSTVDGRAYDLANQEGIAELPEGWAAACGRPRERSALDRAVPLVDLDGPFNIERAIAYLAGGAPSHGTYIVACHVRGLGISQEKCLELIVEHWPGADGKTYDHIETRVRNAYTYAQDPAGIACAEVEFEALDVAPRQPPAGNWDEPADLWKQGKPPADMLEGIVPPFLNAFGRDRARSLGVNSDAITAAAVAVVGSLIPASNRLQMFQNRSSWSVLCVLWTALVGDPGSAKSAAVKAALAFANPVNKAWSAAFAKEMANYDRAELAFSARTSKKKKTEEPVEPDGHPADVMAKPTPPKSRSKISNDSTTEAIVTRLAETPEVAPLIQYSDELSGWLGGMDAYRAKGSKDRALWLEAKEGASYRVDRQGRGSVEAPNLAVSIIGGIQDDLIARLAPDLETDGLLQRFALIAIRQLGLGEDNAEDPAIEAAIPRIALALAGLGEATYRFATAAAEELWAIKAFKAREMARPDIPSGLKTWLAKTDAEFGRYALAFHLIEWAIVAEAIELPPDDLISAATARRARRYVEEFLYAHALFIHTTVFDGGGHDHEARWVAGYILSRNVQRLSAREVKRARPRSLGKNPRQLMAVMGQLEVDGWVRLVTSDPPSWRINPAVHDGRFNDIRRAETERREAVRGEIAIAAASRRAQGGAA